VAVHVSCITLKFTPPRPLALQNTEHRPCRWQDTLLNVVLFSLNLQQNYTKVHMSQIGPGVGFFLNWETLTPDYTPLKNTVVWGPRQSGAHYSIMVLKLQRDHEVQFCNSYNTMKVLSSLWLTQHNGPQKSVPAIISNTGKISDDIIGFRNSFPLRYGRLNIVMKE